MSQAGTTAVFVPQVQRAPRATGLGMRPARTKGSNSESRGPGREARDLKHLLVLLGHADVQGKGG
eukprot:7518857-Alexandrium_andersonii.AAC.1